MYLSFRLRTASNRKLNSCFFVVQQSWSLVEICSESKSRVVGSKCENLYFIYLNDEIIVYQAALKDSFDFRSFIGDNCLCNTGTTSQSECFAEFKILKCSRKFYEISSIFHQIPSIFHPCSYTCFKSCVNNWS